MKCPKCGNEISIKSNYCHYCGNPLWFWEKGDLSSGSIDTGSGKLAVNFGKIYVTFGEVKFIIDIYNGPIAAHIESDPIRGKANLDHFKNVVIPQGTYNLSIKVLRRIDSHSPWILVENQQGKTTIYELLDLVPTTYYLNFYGKIRDKIDSNKPVSLTWSQKLPLKGYIELFNDLKNEITDVDTFTHKLEFNGKQMRVFYTKFDGRKSNKIDFFGRIGDIRRGNIHGIYTITHKNNNIPHQKKFTLKIKLPKILDRQEKFYLGIDFGTVRTSIGILSQSDGTVYLPKIGRSVYFFPSKFLDFIRDNGIIADASPNQGNVDIHESIFPVSITEPVEKNESLLNNIKLKIFKNTLIKGKDIENKKYGSFISGMWLDYLLHSLLLMWNPDDGFSAPDFFTGKLGGVVLGIPPMWGKEYKRILEDATKKLLSKLIDNADSVPITFVEESWAPIWALPIGELNGYSHVLVWDFGGGTTDIAFYKINEKSNPELVAWSEGLLGGTDIDEYLKDRLVEQGVSSGALDLNYLITLKEKQTKCDNKDDICRKALEILSNDVPQELEKYVTHLLKDINDTYHNFTGGDLNNEALFLKVLLIGGSSKLKFGKSQKKSFSVLIENAIKNEWNVKKLDVQVIGKEKTVEGMLKYYVTMVSSTRDKIITLPKGVLHQDYGCLSGANVIAKIIGRKGENESILRKRKCDKGHKRVRIINDLYDFDGKILNKDMTEGVIGYGE